MSDALSFDPTADAIESPREGFNEASWARIKLRLLKIGVIIVAFLTATAIALLKFTNFQFVWYSPFFQIYSIIAGTFVLTRIILSCFYREPADAGHLPSVSMIIAVKNEEDHIAETVDYCFRGRYPSDLREVMVIDDGSTDRTWEVLNGLLKIYPCLRIFKFDKNKGKRHAMALGAEQAKNEILVYVDSDSFLEFDALYKIVQPFADPTIGAVAGHIQVIVDDTNPISKMESIRYYVSHRLVKAAESIYGAVTCCSGAFSAYRRDAVMRVLQPWLNQMFLGTIATFGDDRSLTNFVLKTHRVVFHAGAVCRTFVPSKWGVFFRQQLRWKKSWTRESLIAAKLLWRKHPIAAVSYYASVFLTVLSPIVVVNGLLYAPMTTSASCLPYLGGLLLSYFLMSLICFYHTQTRYWYYGIMFAFLYVGVLAWQNYYAMLTVNRTYWGTR
jgi:hyaluronan synthase